MIAIPHSPVTGIYPASGDYVHAMEVRDAARWMFVAGTMGLHPDGRPGESLDLQLTLIWDNIRTILADAQMTVHNIVRLTSYLSDPGFAEANAQARISALGSRPIPTTAVVVQTLSPDWLVEIEVVAVA